MPCHSGVANWGDDHEVVAFWILQGDEFEVISTAFVKANQSQKAFGTLVDGGDLVSIQSKASSVLHNGILHQEERKETSQPGSGNKRGLHAVEKHIGVLVLEAQVEGIVCIGKSSTVGLHPIHCISMLILETFSKLPFRQVGSNVNGPESASISAPFDFQVVSPKGLVHSSGLSRTLEELRSVVPVDQGKALVSDHQRSEEEAAFVVLVNHSHSSSCGISWTEVSCSGEGVDTNLGEGLKKTGVDNTGEDLGSGSCDVLDRNTHALHLLEGSINLANGSSKLVGRGRGPGSAEVNVVTGICQSATKGCSFSGLVGSNNGVEVKDSSRVSRSEVESSVIAE